MSKVLRKAVICSAAIFLLLFSLIAARYVQIQYDEIPLKSIDRRTGAVFSEYDEEMAIIRENGYFCKLSADKKDMNVYRKDIERISELLLLQSGDGTLDIQEIIEANRESKLEVLRQKYLLLISKSPVLTTAFLVSLLANLFFALKFLIAENRKAVSKNKQEA